MRRLLLAAVLASAVSALGVAAEITDGPLAPGKNVPGTFHAFNLTARVPVKVEPDSGEKKGKSGLDEYSSAGKFHCLISEYDLDPVVMLFARGAEKKSGFGKLLQEIDGAIDRNPGVRLRAFVVFIDDGMTRVAEADDRRVQRAAELVKQAEPLKLRHVVLTLAGTDDLPRYPLDKGVPLTVVMYRNLRIVGSRTLTGADLENIETAEMKAVMNDVRGKMRAKN